MVGFFRKSAEITMQLLRVNKDSLINVLEAYVHDPLVEWQDERNKKVGYHRLHSLEQCTTPYKSFNRSGSCALKVPLDLGVETPHPVCPRFVTSPTSI